MASNHERQMWAVQNLMTAPRECCVIDTFRTEEWKTGHVYVHRSWFPSHAPSLQYTDAHVVGPRGGIKQISSHGPL